MGFLQASAIDFQFNFNGYSCQCLVKHEVLEVELGALNISRNTIQP